MENTKAKSLQYHQCTVCLFFYEIGTLPAKQLAAEELDLCRRCYKNRTRPISHCVACGIDFYTSIKRAVLCKLCARALKKRERKIVDQVFCAVPRKPRCETREIARCCYCDSLCVPTKDHVIPKCRGGRFTMKTCSACNTSKGSLSLVEWLARLPEDSPQHIFVNRCLVAHPWLKYDCTP